MSKKTLKIVKKTKNEAVLQVKNNHPSLFEECKKITINQHAHDRHTEQEKARNRIEYRTVSVYYNPKFKSVDWNKYIKALICVRRDTEEFNTKTKKRDWRWEISFYIATKTFTAKKSNKIIRGHWGIENRNHYVKDVSMNEDKSRIRKNPQNIARLRSFALNLMRINNSININRDLYRNAINIDRVLNYKYLKD